MSATLLALSFFLVSISLIPNFGSYNGNNTPIIFLLISFLLFCFSCLKENTSSREPDKVFADRIRNLVPFLGINNKKHDAGNDLKTIPYETSLSCERKNFYLRAKAVTNNKIHVLRIKNFRLQFNIYNLLFTILLLLSYSLFVYNLPSMWVQNQQILNQLCHLSFLLFIPLILFIFLSPRNHRFSLFLFGLLIGFVLLLRLMTLEAYPYPIIDVYVILKEAPIKFLSHINPYNTLYTYIFPGITPDYYAYWPAAFILQIPFILLSHDPRILLLLADIGAALLLYAIAGKTKTSTLLVLIYLFQPLSLFIIANSWLTPLNFFLITLIVYLLSKLASGQNKDIIENSKLKIQNAKLQLKTQNYDRETKSFADSSKICAVGLDFVAKLRKGKRELQFPKASRVIWLIKSFQEPILRELQKSSDGTNTRSCERKARKWRNREFCNFLIGLILGLLTSIQFFHAVIFLFLGKYLRWKKAFVISFLATVSLFVLPFFLASPQKFFDQTIWVYFRNPPHPSILIHTSLSLNTLFFSLFGKDIPSYISYLIILGTLWFSLSRIHNKVNKNSNLKTPWPDRQGRQSSKVQLKIKKKQASSEQDKIFEDRIRNHVPTLDKSNEKQDAKNDLRTMHYETSQSYEQENFYLRVKSAKDDLILSEKFGIEDLQKSDRLFNLIYFITLFFFTVFLFGRQAFVNYYYFLSSLILLCLALLPRQNNHPNDNS